MSEKVPLGAGGHFLNPSLAPSPFTATAGGPLPVLCNARIAGRCRVVDCQTDLNTQTNTNRKYYLCRDHWAAEAIIVEGIPQRFCGQCSRFKILSEYDGPKRTCRQCLLLRNTKKRNQRYENLQRAAYASSPPSLPPYQLSSGNHLPSAVQTAEALPRPSLPTTAGLYPTRFYNNNISSSQHNNSPEMAFLQQQLLQLQQGLPAEALAPHQPQPQSQLTQQPITNVDGSLYGADTTTTTIATTSPIDVDSLDSVLGQFTAVGSLGDGHTGNAEADALFYLFQELKTLKHEVETKGIALASMEAKRRKLAAEQQLARVNLEVADIEEQLIQVAVINKQHEQQQQQRQGLEAAELAYQMLERRINRSAIEEVNMSNKVIHQSTYIVPTIITTPAAHHVATTTATLPPPENFHTVENNKHNKDGSGAPDDPAVNADGEGPSSVTLPQPPDTEEEPKITRRTSSG